VVLAQVNPPASTRTPLNAQSIDNSVRRQLFSTALLQDQLIRCCCRKATPTPAQVVSCKPAPDENFTEVGVDIITVTFSKSIQPASINKSSFIVQAAVAGAPLLDGAYSYDDTSLTATFRPNPLITVGSSLVVYVITVRGSGPSPVMDVDNLALDGEFQGTFPSGDGKAGGDFHSKFTLGNPK
jgi:hypothetical protein